MAKTTETLHLAVPIGMTERIDNLRGDIARSRFITRLLEKGLEKKEKKISKKADKAEREAITKDG